MARRSRTRPDTPDEPPGLATSDPPLNWRGRTAGPHGLPGKIVLAALGLVLLFAFVIAMLALSYVSRRAEAPAASTYSGPR